MKKRYITNCVDSTGDAINGMVEHKKCREITYRTFLKHVSFQEVMDLFPIYDKYMSLKNDWHVSYFKSFFEGNPCVYMCHSAIEYIFCEE